MATKIGRLRWLSSLFFALSLALWLVAMAVYVRSKCRADLITLVTDSRHCLVLDWDDGSIEVAWQSPWPGPRLVAWCSAKLTRDVTNETELQALRGPILMPDFDLEHQRFPNGNSYVLKEWRGFSFTCGTEPTRYTMNDASMLNTPWRRHYSNNVDDDWRGYAPGMDDYPTSKVDLKQCYLKAPIWAIPAVASVFPFFWLVTAGLHRWRQRRRSRKGLCVQCAYDLRETPTRCPECGTPAAASSRKTREWKNALTGVATALMIGTLLLRWMERGDGAGLPSGDRLPTEDRGVDMPWKFDPTRSSLLESALGDNGNYTVRVDFPLKTSFFTSSLPTITIQVDGRVIHSWKDLDAFKIHNDVLYGAFPGSPTGGTIMAYDLRTGRELWRSPIRHCPPVDPTRPMLFDPHVYWVQLGLDVDGDNLLIWGEEMSGRYLEIKNLRGGTTIGHHYFEIPIPFTPPALDVSMPNSAVEGQPCELLLTAQYFGQRGSIDRWTVDWKDGNGGSSNLISYSYPPGADRKLPLVVTHVFNPGIIEPTVSVSGFGAGNGPFSAEPMTFRLLPGPPTGLTHNARSSTEIDLAWTNHSCLAGETRIYSCTDGISFHPAFSAPNGSDHFTCTGLKPGTKYWFRLSKMAQYPKKRIFK